ncbi:MAG: TRCF domain-containing protein, partial [Woeseiaceae bacterium]
DLRDLQVELIDRFGLLPDPAKNLMRIAAIKRSARKLGIEKIDAADKGGFLVFGAKSDIDPVALVQLVQNSASGYKLQGSHRLQFRGEFDAIEERFAAVEKLVERLAAK